MAQRKSEELTHIVVDLGLGPMGELDDDCPICRKLRADGTPVHTLDPGSEELVLVDPGGPVGPSIQVTVEPDALLAAALGAQGEVPIDLPPGCRVRHLLSFLCYTEPALREVPSTALAIERGGVRLDPGRALHGGDRLRLVATRLAALTPPS